MPVTLEFVNKGIKENAIIPNNGESLTLDGSLLTKSNVSLNSISSTVTFNINIINNLDEQFVYNVTIDIPLEDEQNSIYNGSVIKEITNISNPNFLKIK